MPYWGRVHPYIEVRETWTWRCKCGRMITAELSENDRLVQCRDCGERYDTHFLPEDAQKLSSRTLDLPETK